MGDRANVVIYEPQDGADPHEAVFLYGHWIGYDLPEILATALRRSRERWRDAQYLARIVFQQMLAGDDSLTGYGISTRMGDNEYPLLVLDMPRQCVVEYPEDDYVKYGFAKLSKYRGVKFNGYDGKWASQREEVES